MINQNQILTKVVRLGTVPAGNRRASVFCKIEVTGGRLSITGVEGPRSSGDCLGGCGQILDSLQGKSVKLAPGWNDAMLGKFLRVWDRWHLNNLRAGSAAQEQWLRENPVPADYTAQLAALTKVKLSPDAAGYVYGTAWNTEPLPQEVFKFLASLPDADITPAWV